MATHQPTNILLHQHSRALEVSFDDGATFRLPCEYLRVYSPSADVRGHGPGQGTLQLGKEDVNINDIEAVGNYAVRLLFDDGHSTGLYTWDYLYQLGQTFDVKWRDYLAALVDAGHPRRDA
ncbi:MAG: DUF971 domain-containing protein [Gammaproteobacteria bacterium]|nr:DUF971 domain-containing protein [Gammaproteobacteria bacterium]